MIVSFNLALSGFGVGPALVCFLFCCLAYPTFVLLAVFFYASFWPLRWLGFFGIFRLCLLKKVVDIVYGQLRFLIRVLRIKQDENIDPCVVVFCCVSFL